MTRPNTRSKRSPGRVCPECRPARFDVVCLRGTSRVRQGRNLPQSRRNTNSIFAPRNASKPYDSNDGFPPAVGTRRSEGAPPPSRRPMRPGGVTSSAPESLALQWAATTDPQQSSRPISLLFVLLRDWTSRGAGRAREHGRRRRSRRRAWTPRSVLPRGGRGSGRPRDRRLLDPSRARAP